MAITAYLYYEDLGSALKFLSKAFGLKRMGRPMSRDGRLNHAAMQLGEDVVMMGWPGPEYKNPRRLGAATQCLLVTVPEVDSHFARAKKAGAKVLEEPKTTPFGQRRYGAEDPEGHQWYFAEERKVAAKKKTARKGSSHR